MVRGAVTKRLEWLDANFLAALNAYLAAPTLRDNPDLAALLAAVRQQTLELVGACCFVGQLRARGGCCLLRHSDARSACYLRCTRAPHHRRRRCQPACRPRCKC